MDQSLNAKYRKALEVLPDIARCAGSRLVLVGGTALTLFYLKHRISIDLDFVPANGNDVKLKEEIKGCMTKNGYRTAVGAFKNQFIIQFEDTSIKVEIFVPERKIARTEEHTFGGAEIRVASMDDILEMKIIAYESRKEARDLFDIFCILRSRKKSFGIIRELVSKNGAPINLEEVRSVAISGSDVAEFDGVVLDAVS